MNTQRNQNALISALVIWIDTYNLDLRKSVFSRLKLKLVQDKVKNMMRPHFDSSQKSQSNKNAGKNGETISYISIKDFKPILENYSSIKTLSPYDSKISSSNHYSTYYSNTTQNGETLENRYQKISLTSKKKNQSMGEDNADKDTFLQNWMLRQNPDFVLLEEYPKSNYCFKKIRSYNQQALDSVRKYSFEGFCEKNIKPEGFWFFRTFDRLKHQKQPLSDSLTYLNQVQTQKALQIFQHLLRAGGQLESKQHYLFHVYKILSILSSESDDLFEESFMQVIKQLESKKLIYMKILCCFCATVKPSARIYLPILNYLMEEQAIMLNENNFTEDLYNYAFYHLIKNFDQPRLSLPSFYELQCFMHVKKIPIMIGFPKQKAFYIEAYTKVQELIGEIVAFYDLDPNVRYLLMIDGCFLQTGILLDKLNLYQNYSIQRKFKEYEKFKSLKALIVLKNMNQYNKSKRCFNIMYNYYIHQYLKGLFPLKEKEIVQIAALIMHSEMINEDQYYFDPKKLISSRLRRKMQTPEDKKKYKNCILNEYFAFHGDKIEARKKIVEILSKSNGYMTHFFKCAVFLDELEQIDNWVGIKKNKLIFIDPQTGRMIRQINYKDISQWGSSKSQLCIKVDHLGRLHIDSFQVEVLISIFQGYINYLYTES